MPDKPTWKHIAALCEQAAAPGGRARLNLITLEGTRLCERALRAGFPLRHVLVSEEFERDDSERHVALRELTDRAGLPRHVAPSADFHRLTAGRGLGDIIAVAPPPQATDLGDLFATDRTERATILVCVDVVEPGNIGALIRTAHASGAVLFVAAGNGDPFHPKAIRTSMGSVFRIPILHVESANEAQRLLQAHGVACVGADSNDGTPLPWLRIANPRVAVFIGSEAHGLEPELSARLDQRVTIPMAGGVDSFSVNAAAAVLLYELRRSNPTADDQPQP